MWYLKNIPKIAHFYWGLNKPLSFIRYISIKSFIINNPDWVVIVHTPKIPSKKEPTWETLEQKSDFKNCKDYFPELKKLNITFMEHNFDKYNFSNNNNEIHKSDLLRWIVLSRQGGVWSDTDIIYTKPITKLVENTEENFKKSTFLCKYPTGEFAIGFLLSSKGNMFFNLLYINALKFFDPKNYQCIGSHLVKKVINSLIPQNQLYIYHLLNYKCVYSLLDNKFNLFFQDRKLPEIKEAIGYHWYGGHPQANYYEINMNEENFKEFKSSFSSFIERYL